jgi:FAD synthase
VEFKFSPPTSREMANIESMSVIFSMEKDNLCLKFDFQVKKIDTSSVTTKINKESLSIERILTPKEYSFGRDMINQDLILKALDSALGEVKMKNVF